MKISYHDIYFNTHAGLGFCSALRLGFSEGYGYGYLKG